MEIIVEGKGSEYITPDEIILNINFIAKGYTYEEVLSEGIKNVMVFVEEILLKNNFRKEDMKTRNFVIKEETKYNKITGLYEPDGYSFNQAASLKFDYNKELLAIMLVSISKLKNPPMCHTNFGIKNEKECRRKILAISYKDAENQAAAIAEASGKTLKYCQKVDFKPFTTNYVSQAMIGSEMMYAEKARYGTVQNLLNTFTPEDILLSETLYCLWIAE